MKPQLKPLAEQTLVITGASSGIGLATSLMAARRGASVVMVARDPEDLDLAAEQVRAEGGGRVLTVVADVADRSGVDFVVQETERAFGGFDTWVNNAGVAIYGPVTETPEEDARQLFETNYWGVVHGSEAAAAHLRHKGGALINIGSIVSDRAIPLQGHYSASKHAVKGFTDALRMELEKEGAPISVTLVKPSAINTPYPEHALNLMDAEPTLPPPAYDPDVVAETILTCAQKPVRDVIVGGKGRFDVALGQWFPRLMDRFMEATLFEQQQRDEPARHREGDLQEPHPEGAHVRGRALEGPVFKRSLYTKAVLHPAATLGALAVVGLGLGLGAALAAR